MESPSVGVGESDCWMHSRQEGERVWQEKQGGWVSTRSQELVSRPVFLGCSQVSSSQGLGPSQPGQHHFLVASRVALRRQALLAYVCSHIVHS